MPIRRLEPVPPLSGLSFYEFFCGGGMARAGLGPDWRCLFANDFDPKKGESYRRNWGSDALTVGDVNALQTRDLPGQADLAWASFPCQDLSLAGLGAGLAGERSGAFWPFWNLTERLRSAGRAPRAIVLENVVGLLTSRGGADFRALCGAFASAGYRLGAMTVDAIDFTPQSRPRLFVIATPPGTDIPERLISDPGAAPGRSRALLEAQMSLSVAAKRSWVWWRLPEPPHRNADLIDLIEEAPPPTSWNSAEATERLLALMAPQHRAKLEAARAASARPVGAL